MTDVRPWLIAVIILVPTLMLGFAAVAVAGALAVSRGPTLADAQRACRTAFADEFDRRMSAVPPNDVVATLTGVELLQSRRTDAGFEVDGVVRYELRTAVVFTASGTVEVRCSARARRGRLTTTVTNRK